MDFADDGMEMPPSVSALIKRCLDGTEPIERPLKYWEQEKFNARHVNVVMLKVAGFKSNEIAQALGYTAPTISWTLNHPYGKKILHALMTARGTRVLDIRTKLDVYADQILDQMLDMTSKSNDLDQVTKVGFGLLDRAGYNATTKVQQVASPQGLSSNGALSRLASALEQSSVVDAHIMPTYVPKPPPEDQGRGEVGSSGQSLGRDSSRPATDVSSDSSDGGIRLAKVSNE